MRCAAAILLLLLGPAIVRSVSAQTLSAPAWFPGFPLRSGTSAILMWTPVPGATGYKVFRREGGGAYREVYRGSSNSYTDPDASGPESLTYRVRALAGADEGGGSEERTLTGVKPPVPPTPIGAISTPDTVTLRWTLPPEGAYSKIYRAELPAGPYRFLQSVQADNFTDRAVRTGERYYYRVSAVDFSGRESPMSATMAAETVERAPAPVAGAAVIRKVVPAGEFSGEEFYPLNQPGVAGFTRKGELYVLDRRSIQFFDGEGVFRRRIEFPGPWGMASGMDVTDDGTIFLAFHSEEVVRRIDGQGKLLEEIRYPRMVETLPNNPNDLAVDGEGSLWILDGVRSQVIRRDGNAPKVRVIGRPRGLRKPASGKDEEDDPAFPAAKRIYRNPFDRRIYLVLGIGAEIRVIDPATMRVVAAMGGLGEGNDKFQGIAGMAFRKNGNLFLLDPFRQVIKEFTPDFRYVATYADVVSGGKVRLSSRLASDLLFREDPGRFYIVSTMENRVFMFDIPK